jgi:uncharacterized protein DUF3300
MSIKTPSMRPLARPTRDVLSLAFFVAVLMVGAPLFDAFIKTEAAASSESAMQSQTSGAVPPTVPASASAAEAPPGPPPAMATAQQLEELVSPIALYPDVLIAQVLAGSTYPTQVVEADRWLKANSKLSSDQLAAAVNAQQWDPSIKSLTQFPPVLNTMSESLAWTSALGEAYYNQPVDVMNAIQSLRNRAVGAGTLKSTSEQKVEVQPAPAPAAVQGGEQPTAAQQTVIIQPAQPNTVYVPQYNPETVYGAPVQAPSGYTGTEMVATGLLSFGVGMAMGALINEGNNDWACDWHGGGGGSVNYNNNVYVSQTNNMPQRGYAGANPRSPAAGGPRPTPYRGVRAPYNPAGASTRPYNPANARRYAANNPNIAKPNFPKANTLPSNGLTSPNRNLQQNRPAQPASRPAQNRPAANRPTSNGPATTANRGGDSARGYGGGRDATGSRNGAFGGRQPAGLAQASSNRGRASFGGGGGGGFGGGGGGGGGGRGGGGRGRR